VKPPEACETLGEVREAIDALDREVVALLGRRARYVEAAARFKGSEGDVQAPERQRAMLAERRRWAAEEDLSPELIEGLYRGLISHFVGREMTQWKSGGYSQAPPSDPRA